MSVHAGYNLTESDGTTPKCGLGDEADICGATYKYIKASAAIDAYSLVKLDEDGNAAEADSTNAANEPADAAIPQFALASGEYGWAPVGPFRLREDGSTTFKVLSKIATANLKMYTSATPGSVDDASGGGAVLVSGLTLSASQTVDDTATACIAVGRLGFNKS